ncbi:alcohol dehydrogenase catalytic domain-containing protein [Streptomyces luteogriseus]|uniref:alcohol dehydrogenase catalytic domain-containing protein n=1 Tax=Streptomyces luteogriseus TaxID=68233 RepID=UPI00381C9C1C
MRVDATTVCGSDLRILRGDLPEVKPGTVLGHEAVGEVLEVGRDVHHVRPGDAPSSRSAQLMVVGARGRGGSRCLGGGRWVAPDTEV